MYYIGVDLGSTNWKAAAYNEAMECVAWESIHVAYDRENGAVEFDAQQCVRDLCGMIRKLTENGIAPAEIAEISFTGQAESLVILGEDQKPLMNAISWMDERPAAECAQLAAKFPQEVYEGITGQLAVLPTWPATKILWLKHEHPEIFSKAKTYMLLKDYIVFALSGKMEADPSIATFSFYFDIYRKAYWKEMLDAIGITESQLPPLGEPCTCVGTLLPEIAEKMNLPTSVKVNHGTLDHFAGMIGTGNVKQGGVSLSTGTVMALATIAGDGKLKDGGVAMHYGFSPNLYIALPVIESGGASLEWFKKTALANVSYDEINRIADERTAPGSLVFLPYLVGTNAPEFDSRATGVFWGLRQEHDAFDMASAVMEGMACVLRKNCDDMRKKGIRLDSIIATGGGSKSPVMCQLQADFTGLPVIIPAQKEAACLGAAMIAAIDCGQFASFEEAAAKVMHEEKRYEPRPSALIEKKYHRFCALYEATVAIADIE